VSVDRQTWRWGFRDDLWVLYRPGGERRAWDLLSAAQARGEVEFWAAKAYRGREGVLVADFHFGCRRLRRQLMACVSRVLGHGPGRNPKSPGRKNIALMCACLFLDCPHSRAHAAPRESKAAQRKRVKEMAHHWKMILKS
jgi:hypothetical protein